MDHLGVRALRSQLAAVVRRAGNGETVVITVDGVPTAALGPLGGTTSNDLSSLLALGLVAAPEARSSAAASTRDEPLDLATDVRIDDLLDELRG
jgi:antitoxin (DNA-binding transcriptional repressor) of toxin-antitoxin stability system